MPPSKSFEIFSTSKMKNEETSKHLHAYILFVTDLLTVRTYSAGISVNDNQIWITGGYNFQFDYSTEFISLDQPSKLGPYLPQGTVG